MLLLVSPKPEQLRPPWNPVLVCNEASVNGSDGCLQGEPSDCGPSGVTVAYWELTQEAPVGGCTDSQLLFCPFTNSGNRAKPDLLRGPIRTDRVRRAGALRSRDAPAEKTSAFFCVFFVLVYDAA